MFYSHEILTSRKYGVATVWLVATLGAKSSTKKVTRKAILGVDLKKACETIMEPEAPMALRLQSNLLYGVSKVYNQQWEYLLTDVQAAQNNMRAMLRTARSGELDPNAGKANRNQLILMDDPAFSPDIALPALAFDLDRALTPQADTQRSSQSMLSIRGRSGSVSSLHAASVLGLDIGSSSNGGGGAYQLPPHDLFRESSAQKEAGGKAFEDEELILQDDDLFDFDDDGQLRDIPASERESRRAGSMLPPHRLGSDSAASGRVRKEHEDAQVGRILPVLDADGDFDMMQFGDDDLALPDAEPFPVIAAAGGNARPSQLSDEDRVPSSPEGEPSSISAEAPQKQRKKAKKPKVLKKDERTTISNGELSAWQREYLDHMAAQSLINNRKKEIAQAKINAFHYVFGSGLNATGEGIGSSKLASPLEMFAGETLMARLTGKQGSKAKGTKTKKRTRADEDEDEEGEGSNKRARGGEEEIGRAIQAQGQSQDEDNIFNIPSDDPLLPILDNPGEADASIELERGRDAPSALADYPSSAMPWNVSASLHSHQRGQSSSIHGHRMSQLGSQAQGRRLTSASPLLGRGSALPGELDDFDELMGMGDDDEMVMYGRSDNEDGRSSSQAPAPGLGFANLGLGIRSSGQGGGTGFGDEIDEFELFGAAAAVDTQTAAESQWVRTALDRESENFLEYVRNSIEERSGDELALGDGDEDEGDDVFEEKSRTVTFEQLFDPERNTCMVAAQAFYHVLSLATKRRVWVEQEVVGMEPWGEIRIGVLS
ncbi:hypothetical protein EG329_003427 [Mollisiaceae sp. DMI_Dod_QoI]|nr:hypothetical protein EG329_003427 [Helotiales sp. DMI_Dod_QoI]